MQVSKRMSERLEKGIAKRKKRKKEKGRREWLRTKGTRRIEKKGIGKKRKNWKLEQILR